MVSLSTQVPRAGKGVLSMRTRVAVTFTVDPDEGATVLEQPSKRIYVIKASSSLRDFAQAVSAAALDIKRIECPTTIEVFESLDYPLFAGEGLRVLLQQTFGALGLEYRVIPPPTTREGAR